MSGVWVQRGSDIDGEAAGDQSGVSVSLSADGSIVAIGASNNNGNGVASGHVRVYEWQSLRGLYGFGSSTGNNAVTDIRTYVPSQTERADQIHQLTCPCAGGQPAAPTDYATRDRKIRSIATGCCARYAVDSGVVTGGAGFTTGNYLSLVGGTPVDKPLLFRVTNVNGGGVIATTQIAYSAQYYQKPTEPYSVLAQPGATGSGTLTTGVTWADVCPCPWQYTKTS